MSPSLLLDPYCMLMSSAVGIIIPHGISRSSYYFHHSTTSITYWFAENPIVIYYEVVNMRDKTGSQT